MLVHMSFLKDLFLGLLTNFQDVHMYSSRNYIVGQPTSKKKFFFLKTNRFKSYYMYDVFVYYQRKFRLTLFRENNFFLKYGCKAPLVEFIYTYNLKFWKNDLQNLNECVFRKAGDQNSEITS